ncbi:hypothetical protein BKA62DRAFT_676733 [Auriculariales sp. MPI-PUGE-AT-0066]|nr:hypothetical protein BKA62DRAFT_676733 [Auriculariales sp. MPI-PUGE-AT-0066]
MSRHAQRALQSTGVEGCVKVWSTGWACTQVGRLSVRTARLNKAGAEGNCEYRALNGIAARGRKSSASVGHFLRRGFLRQKYLVMRVYIVAVESFTNAWIIALTVRLKYNAILELPHELDELQMSRPRCNVANQSNPVYRLPSGS